MAMFLQNADLSDNDRARAKEAQVALFDEDDLEYYLGLVGQLGPAAKYQFLADCCEIEDGWSQLLHVFNITRVFAEDIVGIPSVEGKSV